MTRPRRVRSDSVQSPLETYLREINETALLSADQEKQLAYRIDDGDTEARDQMVKANLRLVVNIARSYTGKGLGLQDLIEEGNLGLLRAVEGFDPSMNTRFSTYASYWIKQSIKRALVNTAKTIRIPAYMVELLAKWRRASTSSRTTWAGSRPRRKSPRSRTAEEEAEHHQEGDPRLQFRPAIGPNRAAAGRIDEMLMDGRSKTPDTEMVETDDLKQCRRHARKDGPARSDRAADALRPGRRRTEDPQRDRRTPGPDPRARPADRERGPAQIERKHDRGLKISPPRHDKNCETRKRIVPRRSMDAARSAFSCIPVLPFAQSLA